jgi:hypothetical protein
MTEECVYVLTNPSFRDNMVKIGYTKNDIRSRSRSLFNTSVPTPFKIEFVIVTPDGYNTEKIIHQYLDYCRVSECREFFEISINELKRILVDELKYQITLYDEAETTENTKLKKKKKQQTSDKLDGCDIIKKKIKPPNRKSKYYCKCCDYSAGQKSHYDKHMKSKRHARKIDMVHEKKERMNNKTFKCEHCNKMFTLQKNMNRHIKTACKVVKENENFKLLESKINELNQKLEDLSNKNSN